MGKPEEEIRIYDDVVKHGSVNPLSYAAPGAERPNALDQQGLDAWKMGKPEEEIRIYDDVIKRFGESSDLSLREQVAQALIQGLLLDRWASLKRRSEFMMKWSSRFGESTDCPSGSRWPKPFKQRVDSWADEESLKRRSKSMTMWLSGSEIH